VADKLCNALCDDAVLRLLKQHLSFLERYTHKDNDAYRAKAVLGQQPEIMIISCSDSRVIPSLLLGTSLGEIFTVSNVANIVPPSYSIASIYGGVGAALEFAVTSVGVKHIIIMGHSCCAGIRNLMLNSNNSSNPDERIDFVGNWLKVATLARDAVYEKYPDISFDEQCSMCERESLTLSLKNLETFSWIADRIASNTLKTHAWHFDIGAGSITGYERDSRKFVPISALYQEDP